MSTVTNNSGRDKLFDEIARIEETESSAVKPSLPKTKLDEISYTPPDDRSIANTAQDDLADYKSSTEASIKQKSADSAVSLAEKRDAYEADKQSDMSELDRKYADAARAIDNDVIKRGLARSSVATSYKSDLQNEYLRQSADIIAAYGKNISAVDAEIVALDGKLREALNDFNLTYATKLNQKIAELKAEREAKIKEVTAFNNSVRQNQAKLDMDREKTESSLYSQALEQEKMSTTPDGLSVEKRDQVYRAVYDKMDKYLASLSPHDAKIELVNHTVYRQHLSQYYYAKLYDKYAR